MSDDKYYTGSEFPIVSKSEMKRVATLDPIAAAGELERLRKEIEMLKKWQKDFVEELRCYSTGNSVLSEDSVKKFLEVSDG